MTQEEKELLLKDLCARLPYGVICSCLDNSFTPPTMDYELVSVNLQDETVIVSNDVWNEEFKIENIKPYLRPMSDMTADEEEQWSEFLVPTSYFDYENNGLKAAVFWDELCNAIDWLNEHHFDYRNLIGKGLALEAPKGMYNIK